MATSMAPTENGTGHEPTRKRLRTSHACDVCRARKIRCDGNNPCASCAASENDCSYGSEANSRGKSDLILEGVLRVEKVLQELRANMMSPTAMDGAYSSQLLVSPMTVASTGRGSFSGSQTDIRRLPRLRTPPSEPNNASYLENAVLDSMHTSTTESVLQWPHFDAFPSLREDYVSIFDLEQSRLPFLTRGTPVCPYASPEDVDAILDAFGHAVNFWYPTLSRDQLHRARTAVVTTWGFEENDNDAEGCLALLTMALGCASQVVSGLVSGGGAALSDDERKRRAARRAMGDMYFDRVLKKLHVVHTDVSPTAAHCLFFVALYFAFLRRPLQAWEYINAAAAKCLLLLSYPPRRGSDEDLERIRRIFWSCYILESDYLAELSGLPQSGIARIESSIPLPGAYHTHISPQEEEQSSLYFLACISMRRLLNRVHQLLYARTTGASLDNTRFPYVVAELDHQLEEWRDVLPAAFAFSVGPPSFPSRSGTSPQSSASPPSQQPTVSEHGGFLRQRYLTCRSVIYRPYLMWALSGAGGVGYGDGLDGPDTWICSLSMAAAMLVLLAACRVPALRSLIGPEVLGAGAHLRELLEDWRQVCGEPSSPSVDQSVRVIGEADGFIRQVYELEGPFPALRK
ncbi:hypothetical protein VTK73DRAFT_8009 [Phialemonium thermophilum]|uniref:Zn(2)-C6 fungal-type domain-containing protein n=1 Tax=Phialemonium thermophilum TaxID=223376 RepID=A0ABR3XQW9_9PEZI